MLEKISIVRRSACRTARSWAWASRSGEQHTAGGGGTCWAPSVIASASLGQVYVGHVLRDDERIKVAVKVQRPGVAETIALDLHLLRIGAGPLKALFQANTDLVGLVDTWGVRFVDELDYVREAGHAVDFSRAIAETPLCGAVFAPEPLEHLTSRKVLTGSKTTTEQPSARE